MQKHERARKTEREILQAISRSTGKELAERMDTSESTVSRMSGEVDKIANYLTALGLKVQLESDVVISKEEFNAQSFYAEIGFNARKSKEV